jgi:hypothetical protein
MVWQQRNICNLSGAKGDWKVNSLTKLSFDEIVPRNPADDKVKGGDYTLQLRNIQIVLRAINEMKWNYSNEKAMVYLNTRFAQ